MNGQYNIGDVVLHNWTLTRLIGQGSFGRVFEAEREDFGRTYEAAIKIITIPQSQNDVKSAMSEGMDEDSATDYFRSLVEELVDEFSLMSKLKGNSNIVSYEDHGVHQHSGSLGWDILIRMELLTPLLDTVQRNSLTRNDVVKIGMDICKALQLCQRHNVIHRDVKPENIFVSDTGDYKLGDFGIARTVEKTLSALSKKGTYTYMAPEMYCGDPYTANVDIYSLGIVMYRLLNEHRVPFLPAYPSPITHNDRETALAKRMAGLPMPAPRNADGRLAEIILRACAHNPHERYASPQEMREDLQDTLSENREFYALSVENTANTPVFDNAAIPQVNSDVPVFDNAIIPQIDNDAPVFDSAVIPQINNDAPVFDNAVIPQQEKTVTNSSSFTDSPLQDNFETNHDNIVYPPQQSEMDIDQQNAPLPPLQFNVESDSDDFERTIYLRPETPREYPQETHWQPPQEQQSPMTDLPLQQPQMGVPQQPFQQPQPFQQSQSQPPYETLQTSQPPSPKTPPIPPTSPPPQPPQHDQQEPGNEPQERNKQSSKKGMSPLIKFGAPIAAVIAAGLLLYIFVFSDTIFIGGGNGDDGDSIGGTPPTTTVIIPEISDPPAPSDDDIEINNDEDMFYEDGVLVKQIIRDVDGMIIGRWEFHYHNNGAISERVKFDNDDNAIRRDFYDENGDLSYWWETEYNTNNNRTHSIRYDSTGLPLESHEYRYNISGIHIERVDNFYDSRGNIDSFNIYQLSESGEVRIARTYTIDNGNELLGEIQEFSNDGILVKHTIFSYDDDGNLSEKSEFEYDEETSLLMFIHEYNSEEVKVRIVEYDYDDDGEMTERREKDLNARGVVVTTRYYRPGSLTPYRTDPPPTAPSTAPPSETPSEEPPPPIDTHDPDHGGYNQNQMPFVTYDGQGRRHREYYYYNDGCVSHYREFIYDEEGSLRDIVTHYG